MSDESAIQQDVQQVIEQPKERELSPREEAMAAIAASRTAEFEKETGVKLDAPVIDPDVNPVITDPPSDPAADQLAAQLESTPAAPAMVKVKIDGIESEVPLEELTRQYQKNSSADKRLAEATRLLREAEARQAPVAQTETPKVEIDSESGKQFTAALFEGDETKASQAFADAVSKAVQVEVAKMERGNTIPDVQAITQTVKQQLVVESALEQSKTDYPQMYSDPDIEALGAAKIARKVNDEGLSFSDALKSVGTEFATKFGWNATGRQETPVSTTARTEKLERKAGIDNVASLNVKSTTQETPPQTTSDVLAEMRKARGLD